VVDEVEIEFALEALLDDLEMKKAEKAGAEAEAERRRGLGSYSKLASFSAFSTRLVGSQERRGVQKDLTYAGNRAMMVYRLPLNEVVFDFYEPPQIDQPRLRQL